MTFRSSTKEHWETFWHKKTLLQEVYSNEDRIYENLGQVTEIQGKKILEVGAGTGRDSVRLAIENATVYVLDYSPQALKLVKDVTSRNVAPVHLIQGDAFQIPTPDESMDIVFHQGLMEHFRDPLPLLKEHYRILKPGGFLLVDVPQLYHYYTLIKHLLIFFDKWFAGWETEFSIRQLKTLIEQSGFTVQREYGRWMRPSLLYRVIREGLKKINIRLPLYPSGCKFTRSLRDWLRERFSSRHWAFYTFLDIGVIGQKKIAN